MMKLMPKQARTVSDIEREFHSISFAEKNNVSTISKTLNKKP